MKKKDAWLKMEDNKYYILASSNYADNRVSTLNFEDTFGVFDRWGDIRQAGHDVQGIYHMGTRYISHLELGINNYRALLLSSNIKTDNEIMSVDLTNPDMEDENGFMIPKGSIHIARSKFLGNGAIYEHIELSNYGTETYSFEIDLDFNADFRDIFEVRGMMRERRGKLFNPEMMGENVAVISYKGLDNIQRNTHLRFDPVPDKLQQNHAVYRITLGAKQLQHIYCTAVFRSDDMPPHFENYNDALSALAKQLKRSKESITEITTNNEQFSNWLHRSRNDLRSLLVQTPQGLYPYAGVPWYNTAFGRDGIITALQTLWIAPEISKGVLTFLANRQATETDPVKDAEPGKIMHEMRYGEMAETGEIPFKLYYGGIDTTPLFIMLAGHYLRRTNDTETIRKIWPNILAAVEWIDVYGDIDGDGFIEYERKTESGLANQGWKDSHDSISHKNGDSPTYPISLCEVQAYVYDAKIQAAYIAKRFDENELAEKWEGEAAHLKKIFNDIFWDELLDTYVLALDGNKKPCRIISSNAGHTLFCGIATPEKAEKTVKTLMREDMFNGWGIRTLSAKEVRYNPMSYHNGSVWPHDTSMIAYGFARYGMFDEAMKIMQGLFDASLFVEWQRLPELFCGFNFRKGEAPTNYPVACSPQAWSVASVYMLLQACLQLTIDAHEKKMVFNHAVLPPYIKTVTIKNLKCGESFFSIEIFRYAYDLGIHVINKPEGWEVVAIK